MTRLTIIAFIVAAVLLLFRWFLKPSPGGSSAEEGPTEMVMDPNCLIYIPRTEAIRKTLAGQEHFFCSEKCAEEYKAKTRPA